jgi:predicted ATP-dependent protease
MDTTRAARELRVDELAWNPSDGMLDFESTEELEPLDEILGQQRALKALDLGLGIDHATYNIYVAGLNGTGKKETIRRILDDRVTKRQVPPDWVYLNNFDQKDCPIAVALEPGAGKALRQDMEELVRHLREELPKAFQQEDFGREKQRINRKYDERSQEWVRELEELAREKGLAVQLLPSGGMNVVPLKDDRPMTPDEYEELSEEEKSELSERQRDLASRAGSLMSRGQQLKRELGDEARKIERDFAARVITPGIEAVKKKHPNAKLEGWFDRVEEHMVDNAARFLRPQAAQEQAPAGASDAALHGVASFDEYGVNVVVDNGGLSQAPVIIEDVPNYKNLFGTTGGKVDRMGRVVDDFSQIRAGSLLRANGGYLVLNLLDALVEPLVWKELKRSIKNGMMEFHAYDPLGVFTAAVIRPQPIPLHVKLVVLGNPLVYHVLHLYDDDFAEIFKVKADFDSEMDIHEDTGAQLGQFVRKLSAKEGILPFTASGITELMRAAVRLAEDKSKVTTEFSRLADVVREASFWAKTDACDSIDSRHVRRAIEEKVYRSNLMAEKIRELIREGILLIDVDGRSVGRVNGLSVIDLGDYKFGRASRVTASVGVGSGGVINIERESKLSGRSYDKAMLILEGYMRNTYAGERPLTLSAGIAMEQSYGMIEGDSASVAELVCLLSAVAGIPLRQDIGLTGSFNQWGQVQAVGGINEKVEGFFDVCRELGLNGRQGVCIPEANVRHLVLRPDVVEAVRAGNFHVWSITHVNDALALLSDLEAGAPEITDSFHGRVNERLSAMATALGKQRAVAGERTSISVGPSAPAQPDPRPPLPVDEPH